MQPMALEVDRQSLQKFCWDCCSMAMQQVCSAPERLSEPAKKSIPFRFLAGHLHPDHDTIASFRQRFLAQIKELFVQVLLWAVEAEVLTLEDISIDGTKIHADADHSKAVSYGYLVQLRAALESEVEQLLKWGEAADACLTAGISRCCCRNRTAAAEAV